MITGTSQILEGPFTITSDKLEGDSSITLFSYPDNSKPPRKAMKMMDMAMTEKALNSKVTYPPALVKSHKGGFKPLDWNTSYSDIYKLLLSSFRESRKQNK